MNDRARIFLLIGITGLATCIGCMWYFQKEIVYVRHGPESIAGTDLLKVENPTQLPTPWIRFTADKLVPTEAHLVKQNTGKVLGRIYLVKVEDRWLLALLNPNLKGNVIAGEVKTGRPYWSKQISQIESDTKAIHNGKLMPFELFGYDDYSQNWEIGYYFFITAGALGAMFLILGLGSLFLSSKEEPPMSDPSVPSNPWPKQQ